MRGRPERIRVNACAKVNLSLDVGPRDGTGYHALRTVMQTISLADTVEARITPEPGVKLSCAWELTEPAFPEIPTDGRNTAYRAAEAVLTQAGHPPYGVAISITKRIPVEAGLGGGSSDAAAALRAVSLLVNRRPTAGELAGLAISVGSDVPFFLTGGTALVEGIGDRVEPVPAAPPMHLVIAKPSEGVSTGWAYSALDRCPDPRPANTPDVLRALADGDYGALIRALGNHFECVVPRSVPAVAALMERMRSAGAISVRLCGSGSAVFAVTESHSHARRMASALAGPDTYVTVAATTGAASPADLELLD